MGKKLEAFDSHHGEAIGSIGSGNHFAEIQRIEKIIDDTLFEALDLDKSKVLLMIHSGSRGLGNTILRRHLDQCGAAGIDPDSSEGQNYISEHDRACAWAANNRQVVADRILELIGGKSELVCEAFHNILSPLENGRWIHRKGAVEACEKPVVIAGSRGTFSYLVMPQNSGLDNAFSLAHGAGRKWKRNEVKARMSHKYKIQSLQQTDLGSRVICHDRQLIYEEAPQAYKNIETVIDALEDAKLIKVIAILRPVITYKKGDKK